MAIPPLDPIDANFQQATGAFIATSRNGELREDRDHYLVNAGVPVVDYNLVFLKRPDHELEATLDKAAAYFEERKLPYRICLRAEQAGACRGLLQSRGFAERDPIPGMQLEPIPDGGGVVEGLEIRRVADTATLTDFQNTAFEGFGLPVAAAPLFLTEQLVGLPGVAFFVGYVAAEPACTSALMPTTGVAGIYWVATLERFRGRGFGAALTWQAAWAGREQGCRVASLQASQLGQPVYARMGFVHDRDYARFDAPAG
jgi:GNAT superfamily N-acetyltransferase